MAVEGFYTLETVLQEFTVPDCISAAILTDFVSYSRRSFREKNATHPTLKVPHYTHFHVFILHSVEQHRASNSPQNSIDP